MNYAVFRSAVLELLEEDRQWSVKTDWAQTPPESSEEMSESGDGGDTLEDFIELEQEKGPFYVFMTVSLMRLYLSYQEEGWDAVRRELEKYTRRDQHGTARTRGINYEARLNEKGAELYALLREIRSGIAMEKQLPPYFVFMNRSLYEMCCRLPSNMEELRALYGVGEKNSQAYGARFLDAIREYTGGRKMQFMRLPGGRELSGPDAFLPTD